MQLELITIGDELCRGEIVNTNGAWMAASLWDMQMTVGHIVTCGDLPEEMALAIRNAAQRSEVVLVCGGLGPTIDDCTVDVMCSLGGVPACLHEPSAIRMKERFAQIGIPLLDNVMRQVRHPEGSKTYENPVGAAPGFEMEVSGSVVICLPGPPREMKAIFNAHLRERLAAIRKAKGEEIEHVARCVLRVFGKSETVVATELEDLPLPEGCSLHYQVVFPELLVKLVVRSQDPSRAKEQLQVLETEVRDRLGSSLYGSGDQSLAEVVGQLLRERGQTLSTAESCTGGKVGAALTDAAGASEYFVGGAVTYSNAEKTRQLDVSEKLLDTHGAVSEEVALAMAKGIAARSQSDWGVSITGIAGPGGGSPDKPVGTVWIAVAGPHQVLVAKKRNWPGTRSQVRDYSVFRALDAVRRQLLEASEEGASADGEVKE